MLKFTASEAFWANFHKLPDADKELVREKWEIFKSDPFHPSLKTHRINRLSSLLKTNVFSVAIRGDLRVVFYIAKDGVCHTYDIGSHDVYK